MVGVASVVDAVIFVRVCAEAIWAGSCRTGLFGFLSEWCEGCLNVAVVSIDFVFISAGCSELSVCRIADSTDCVSFSQGVTCNLAYRHTDKP